MSEEHHCTEECIAELEEEFEELHAERNELVQRVQQLQEALSNEKEKGIALLDHWSKEEIARDKAEAKVEQLEEENQKLEKALKFQKDQNKMLMEGRRGL